MKRSRMVLMASAAALVLLLGVGVLFSSVYATPARADVASARAAYPLTITRVWTRNAQGQDTTFFTPGQGIQYLVSINNTSGVAFKAQFIFCAYRGYGGNDYCPPYRIFYLNMSNASVHVGTASFYSPSTVPKTASGGSYTLLVEVLSLYPAPNLSAEKTGQFKVG